MKSKLACLMLIASIGAMYANVQGPRAIPKTSPRMNAARAPFLFILT